MTKVEAIIEILKSMVHVEKGYHLSTESQNVLYEVDEFGISKYNCKQVWWEAIMGSNPSADKDPDKPVTNVSYYDVEEFMNAINNILKISFMYPELDEYVKSITPPGKMISVNLPTVQQWGYAARGGHKAKGFKYPGSNNIEEVAFFNENSGGKLQKVGQLKPNELGLYDMLGNVEEWLRSDKETNRDEYIEIPDEEGIKIVNSIKKLFGL